MGRAIEIAKTNNVALIKNPCNFTIDFSLKVVKYFKLKSGLKLNVPLNLA